MATAQFELLRHRRFAPLFVTQALGAFNDNAFKNALVILVAYDLAARRGYDGTLLITIAAGLFILPFFLFSATAGQLADKLDKARLTRRLKVLEILIVGLAAIGFAIESVTWLLALLFLLGTQAAFFGPIKYGILPQHLGKDELIGGNALIETGTFLSILLGTLFGGLVVGLPGGTVIVSAALLAVAVLGYLASRAIPEAPPPVPDLRVEPNIAKSTWTVLRHAAEHPDVLRSILGLSWFWLIGAVILAELPAFAKDALHGDERVTNLFVAIFTVGIGAGSLLCNRLLAGRVRATYVPLAAIGITVFIVDLHFASQGAPRPAEPAALMGIGEFLSHRSSWRIAFDLLAMAACGGIFAVPLYAILQTRGDATRRARTIAANNVVNALAMSFGTAATLVLLGAGFTVREVYLVLGVANAAVAAYICTLLPQDVVKTIGRQLFRLLYRVEFTGWDNYIGAGDRVVIVVNHTSFLDGPLLGAFLPERTAFAINTFVADRWWVKPAFALFDLVPIDPTNPMSAKRLVRIVRDGQKLVIFPEGRITVTGALMKVYEGPGTIAHLADARILPVRISGAQFSVFSRMRGKLRLRLFPKITVAFLESQRFDLPREAKGAELRRFISARLYDIMTDTVFKTSTIEEPLIDTLLAARSTHGASTVIVEDAQRAPMTFDRLVAGAFILGRRIARISALGETVGVLLPNAMGAVATFFALQAYGRVPAMLNFSTGAANMAAACRAARVRTILTSRRFVEAAKLEDEVALLAGEARIVHLEDLRGEIGPFDKLLGLVSARFARVALALLNPSRHADQPAVVLFTSGSEGVPKGVVLSHRNIQANRQQLSARVDFNSSDIVFNALPMFHAFGLTGGTLLPVLSGVRTFLYPSPLHYKIVPELIYDTNATILFGTDTFLAGYAKNAHPYDFYSVRYVFAGAEKVKPETRTTWAEQFGIRLLEGYGATECAPVLAVNTPMQYKAGTVGRLMPGIEARLEAVAGIERGGRLIVRGPNVMLGYLRADHPGVLEPPAQGWYDTGDIVDIDAEGFVTILGRARRFAKIAGEMVSLAAVEANVAAAWPEYAHAVVALPDAKKGERLVLVSEMTALNRKILAAGLRSAGLAELQTPRVILHVDALPILATGKVDYVSINRLARERAGEAEHAV